MSNASAILLISGPGGEAQGWGDLSVTQYLQRCIASLGYVCDIAWVESLADLEFALAERSYALAWSALYYLTSRSDIIGIPPDALWVADWLDSQRQAYIGPDAEALKNLILKFNTHRLLAAAKLPVPRHFLVCGDAAIPDCPLPAFVKPNGESRSIGISDSSVCLDRAALEAQVRSLQQELGQDVLIEEFLPGDEYTVLVLGNGERQEILPGKVTVSEQHYGKYRVLRSDLRGVGLTNVSLPQEHSQEAEQLARAAIKACNCSDHVRLDMRVGADDRLHVIEINAIPGLKPLRSWSPQIYSLYHPSRLGPEEEYRQMIKLIITAALEREANLQI
ncbi:MAG: ATP-grasp domain-containing protein [Lentisphaeria bacterium]|nr:ATP-grasp domain-containing protein [Lentisphaeria bacterium]MDY0176216.1 ATP-grasp domain-containing protein [Lentisphaeria bacterium]NLZ59395.1 ATP-grasp domain-containing protein [Lentisphaerota bacterium]